VLASRIVSYRKANGAFTAIEDLKKVPGIGEITFDKVQREAARVIDSRALALGGAVWAGALLQSWSRTWSICMLAILAALILRKRQKFLVLVIVGAARLNDYVDTSCSP